MPSSSPDVSAFPIGSRVMVTAGKYLGRRGDVVKLNRIAPEYRYVLLDLSPRQRKPERRRELVAVKDLVGVAS